MDRLREALAPVPVPVAVAIAEASAVPQAGPVDRTKPSSKTADPMGGSKARRKRRPKGGPRGG